MDFKDFEQYGLFRDDFKIDVVNEKTFGGNYKKAVKIALPAFGISAQCWSEKTQKANKDGCLKMLKSIIDSSLKKEKLDTDVVNAINKSSKKHEKLFKKLGSE